MTPPSPPGIITGRGVQLGARFRYLQPTYAGRIQGKSMPDDRRSEYNNRAHLIWQHQQQFTPTLSGGIITTKYPTTIATAISTAATISPAMPTSTAKLGSTTTPACGAARSTAMPRCRNTQTLANSDGYKTEPYAIMPRVFHPLAKAAGQRPNQRVRPIHRFDHDENNRAAALWFTRA